MNIKGSYVIRAGNKIIRGNNIITLLGESFFMNRAINNEFDPLKYIVFGNSSIKARKSDYTLGNETVRKRCVSEVNLETKQIILSCSCSASEILGTTEIGVANDDILISHDVYAAITSDFITEVIDSVEITYTFDLSTSATKSEWKYYTSGDSGNTKRNIYYTTEENTVVGVTEENTMSGYRAVKSLDSLKSTTGAYFHDVNTNTLFIRTTKNDNPNSVGYKIVISTR